MDQPIDYHYLDKLNESQREAVMYTGGPSLVIAGAGAGKTRVLTYKIIHLLHSGYEPYRIMALTFTNKAANEMKERIAKLTGNNVASKLWMGTFHSVFLRILRTHADRLGFKSGFTIYDASDSKSLVKTIIKDLQLDDKVYKPAVIASAISYAKNAMLSPERYNADRSITDADRKAKRPLTGKIFEIYTTRCRLSNAMDFDDILYYMNVLLRDNPELKKKYQEFFRYILVDEYQDTNFAQHLVISMLSDSGRNLCVVGDDAQSIYSFRGANIHNILELEKKYPDLKTFKLERNYRSTQNIVNAAGSLIEKNTYQIHKNVYSENESGSPIAVIKTYSDFEEAYLVANLITNSKLTKHDSYEDYAVLYRTNAQSRIIEEALRKKNIPYRIYGGLSFYQRKEVKDAVSYFRLSVNPDDDEALRRIINYPARGIGETTMKKLQAGALQQEKSLWQIICDLKPGELSVNSGTHKKLMAFKELIQEFIDDNNKGSNAYEMAQLIYNRTGILAMLAHDNTPESISRQENLSEMLAGLREFVVTRRESGENDLSMNAFLSEVMLSTDQDQQDDEEGPKVTLMTAHAAKGLEFANIFIVGVEEELFPSALSMDSLTQIEEERRLLYVAITRAKENCTITFAGTRFRNGQTVMSKPSRFLSDMDRKFLNIKSSTSLTFEDSDKFKNPLDNYSSSYRRQYKPTYSPDNNMPDFDVDKKGKHLTRILDTANSPALPGSKTAADVKVGMKIEHQKFGEGTITQVGNLSGADYIVVDFGIVGIKKLLLKFAKFNIK